MAIFRVNVAEKNLNYLHCGKKMFPWEPENPIVLRLEQANLEILQLHLSYIQEMQGRQMFNDGSEEIKKGKST